MEFPPNRSKKNLILLYIASWILIVIGAFIILGSVVETMEWKPFGIGVAIFSFGILIFIFGKYFSAAEKVSYTVTKEGIFLKSTREERSASWNEVESATELKEKTAEEFMLRMRLRIEERNAAIMRGESKSRDTFSKLKEAFSNQKKSFEAYKFLSVPMVYKVKGRMRETTGANIPCDTVFIIFKNGEGYLISPLDTAGFVNEAKKYMSA